MEHNYHSRYLVPTDNEQSRINVYNYEECKLEEDFLVIKHSKIMSIFIGKNRICRMSEMSGAWDSSDFDGNTNLLGSVDLVITSMSLFPDSKYSNSKQQIKL